MRCIEKENQQTLYEIFGDAQWTNKQLFSDKLLIDLIEHFSEHNLANREMFSRILQGRHTSILLRSSLISNKKAGEFYTPPTGHPAHDADSPAARC